MRTIGLVPRLLCVLILSAGLFCATTPPPKPQVARKANPNQIVEFALGQNTVLVSFFDPSLLIKKKHQLFETYDTFKRSQLWDEYLRNCALYLFEVRDAAGSTVRYYCLRGNPARVGFARFLQLETIDPAQLDLQDPNRQTYAASVTARQDILSFGGIIYEHMAEFRGDKAKTLRDADVVYYGRTTRLVMWDEIKKMVSELIQADLAAGRAR